MAYSQNNQQPPENWITLKKFMEGTKGSFRAVIKSAFAPRTVNTRAGQKQVQDLILMDQGIEAKHSIWDAQKHNMFQQGNQVIVHRGDPKWDDYSNCYKINLERGGYIELDNGSQPPAQMPQGNPNRPGSRPMPQPSLPEWQQVQQQFPNFYKAVDSLFNYLHDSFGIGDRMDQDFVVQNALDIIYGGG